MFNFTLSDLHAVTGYLNAETKERPSDQTIKMFLSMSTALQVKLLNDLSAAETRLGAAQKRIDRYMEKEEAFVAENGYIETGIDSVDLAAALVWALQQKGHRLTVTKTVHILYDIYAAWLAGHGERATIEHPVVTAYGPQFWRVYRRFKDNISTPVSRDAFNAIAERFPGLANLVWNAASKYCDIDERDLKDFLLKSKPVRAAMPAKNDPDPKWNNPIDDNLIVQWKKGKI